MFLKKKNIFEGFFDVAALMQSNCLEALWYSFSVVALEVLQCLVSAEVPVPC